MGKLSEKHTISLVFYVHPLEVPVTQFFLSSNTQLSKHQRARVTHTTPVLPALTTAHRLARMKMKNMGSLEPQVLVLNITSDTFLCIYICFLHP